MNSIKIVFSAVLFFILSNPVSLWSQNAMECDALLAKGVDLMWKKKHQKSLEILTKAKRIAEKNQWYKQSFIASNNIGSNYSLMLDYGEALNQYLESYKIAIAHLDESHEIVVLNNIAILYSKEKKWNKAQEYFYKAYTIAKKRNDFIKVGYYSVNLGSVLNETNKPIEAQKYIQESFLYLKKQPDILYIANIVKAHNDLLLGKTKQSRAKAITLIQEANNKFSAINKINLYIIIAKTYLKENNQVQALKWTNKAIAAKPDADLKKVLFQLLSDIYYGQKNYERALVYKDSVNSAEEQLNNIKNGKLFESSQIKLQLHHYQREIETKNAKIKHERLVYFTVLSFTLTLLIFVLIIHRNQLIKNKQCQLIAQNNQEITLLKFQQEAEENLRSKKKEQIALKEQERLKQEIEIKNQKIASKALHLSGKNKLLQEILTSLSKIPELTKNKTVLNHIKELKSLLNTEDDWNNFMLHFEEVNRGLLQKLKVKHPKLNQNDLRYISYEYMNLSTKEIAILLNITPDACRKRRERVIHKLDLTANSSLIDYLSVI